MKRLAILVAAGAIAVSFASAFVACNPTSLKPNYCHTGDDCPSKSCNPMTYMCDPVDGSMDSDGPRDGKDAEVARPFNCNMGDMCSSDAGNNVCDPDGGTCVECLKDDDCLAKNAKAPICRAQLCGPCQTDNDCPDPKICLADGHCATSGEVIYVDYGATPCPGTGSSTSPFCLLPTAVGTLASGHNVIVIRGPADDKLVINTTGFSPVVIGKKNSSGADASIPAGAGTAVSLSSDVFLIRDMVVTGGTAATSKGIVATGSTTNLTLSNVTVKLGTDGLGIQVDNGAQLAMDHCTVTSNPQGGILLVGAQFIIKNTILTGNGPGDDMGASWGGLRIKEITTGSKLLQFVTVMDNKAVGISCMAAVMSDGVYVSGNVGVQISPSCMIVPCDPDAGTACGAQF